MGTRMNAPAAWPGEIAGMMDMMAGCCGGWGAGMMWGMGLFGLLVLVVLVLAAAALVKYLLSGRGGRATEASGPSEGPRADEHLH